MYRNYTKASLQSYFSDFFKTSMKLSQCIAIILIALCNRIFSTPFETAMKLSEKESKIYNRNRHTTEQLFRLVLSDLTVDSSDLITFRKKILRCCGKLIIIEIFT